MRCFSCVFCGALILFLSVVASAFEPRMVAFCTHEEAMHGNDEPCKTWDVYNQDNIHSYVVPCRLGPVFEPVENYLHCVRSEVCTRGPFDKVHQIYLLMEGGNPDAWSHFSPEKDRGEWDNWIDGKYKAYNSGGVVGFLELDTAEHSTISQNLWRFYESSGLDEHPERFNYNAGDSVFLVWRYGWIPTRGWVRIAHEIVIDEDCDVDPPNYY